MISTQEVNKNDSNVAWSQPASGKPSLPFWQLLQNCRCRSQRSGSSHWTALMHDQLQSPRSQAAKSSVTLAEIWLAVSNQQSCILPYSCCFLQCVYVRRSESGIAMPHRMCCRRSSLSVLACSRAASALCEALWFTAPSSVAISTLPSYSETFIDM